MKRGSGWGVVAYNVKTQCQNLNGIPTQTTGVVQLTPNFVDHLLMFIKHGLHQKIYTSGRREFLFWTTRLLFGVDTPVGPPPQTPLPVPPPKQKGYQFAPFQNRHPSAYSSKPETEVLQSYGAKIEIRTPMHT